MSVTINTKCQKVKAESDAEIGGRADDERVPGVIFSAIHFEYKMIGTRQDHACLAAECDLVLEVAAKCQGASARLLKKSRKFAKKPKLTFSCHKENIRQVNYCVEK